MANLLDPVTPFAVVDRDRLDRNVARLHRRLRDQGVPLRLHVKTSKSLDVAGRVFPAGPGPITVSTLAEAEHFAAAGYTDILYAVGIEPSKLSRVLALRARGIDLAVVVDSIEQAESVAAASRGHAVRIPALIEIDCDAHRGGILPTDRALIEIGGALKTGGAELRGVMDHAGESYFARSAEALDAAAQTERSAAVQAASLLRAAGLPCPVVSVGSTPTAHRDGALDGVTEVRAGNYVFFDLVMAGIGACSLDDLALSVVVSVIGRNAERGLIFTDGGWMAMSRDRGTAAQPVDQGYGLVADLAGRLLPGLVMRQASQEHGVLAIRDGADARLPDLALGSRLRIFPNHACATAAQHDGYQVVAGVGDTAAPEIIAAWPRVGGW